MEDHGREISFHGTERSAQFCGCDRGANHLCERHREQEVDATKSRIMRDHSVDGTERLDAYHNHRYNDAEQKGLAKGIEGMIAKEERALGVHNASTRARTLPTDAKGRKATPIASGVLDYFPDALVAVAQVSFAGNEQHNPGQPLHWAREKSTDQDDTIMRHFLQRGEFDTDGQRHSAKMAWRALALLQLEIERSL